MYVFRPRVQSTQYYYVYVQLFTSSQVSRRIGKYESLEERELETTKVQFIRSVRIPYQRVYFTTVAPMTISLTSLSTPPASYTQHPL